MNTALSFKYLKRAAEEGFVEAQHMLANVYDNGDYIKRDAKKALAWYR